MGNDVHAHNSKDSEDYSKVREVEKLADKAGQLVGYGRIAGEKTRDVLIVEESNCCCS